jgi:hypothetical protein
MKKIIIVFSFFALLLSSSCNDSYEIVQRGELNDAAVFTSMANLQQFLNEVYDRAATENDLVTSSLLTDEAAIASGLTTNDTQRFFVVSTNGNAAAIWNAHYGLINYSNRLIRGASYYSPTAAELPAYNSMIAQARALRAFAHFQLLVYFSQDISNPNALGVMLVDRVINPDEDLPRSTNAEIFGLIDSDLTFANANLINPTGANAYKFVSSNFINAFRARMFLYRKNYVLAEQYADAAIAGGVPLASCLFTGAPPANFPLTSAAVVSSAGSTTINNSPGAGNPQQLALWQMDQWVPTNAPAYRRMWVDGIQGESLFSLDRPNNRINFSSRYNTNGSYLSGGPLYDMGRNLFDLYRQPLGGGAEDFRRWSFVDRSATISLTPATASRTNEQIVIDKYPGKTGSHTSNDVKVFRVSEMHFIKAECRARANDFTGAANQIRLVRQERNYIVGGVVPASVYGNATAAYADILLERRKELSFEGHRYIDLKRLGADAGVTGTDRYAQDAVNSSATSPSNILLGDYRFTLPIPQAELNVNPLTQNPGY